MKPLSLYLVLLFIAASCGTKKTETATSPIDSVVVDSTLATTLAPALLAFGAIDGFTANNSLDLPDSVNYFLPGNADQLSTSFTAESAGAPDFIINYVVAVVCKPTRQATTIAMDKVVTGESSIDIYLTITRGEAGTKTHRPTQLFAIERREGYPVMQFYVNGKKDKALVLVENP